VKEDLTEIKKTNPGHYLEVGADMAVIPSAKTRKSIKRLNMMRDGL
jgi:hypothetical protein